jgi:hypothetical protein
MLWQAVPASSRRGRPAQDPGTVPDPNITNMREHS